MHHLLSGYTWGLLWVWVPRTLVCCNDALFTVERPLGVPLVWFHAGPITCLQILEDMEAKLHPLLPVLLVSPCSCSGVTSAPRALLPYSLEDRRGRLRLEPGLPPRFL